MAKKKYYWLKLKNDFFRQKEIKKLRQIAGGDTYVIIYLKMQLLSLQNGGRLFFEGYEDTFSNELALELDEDAENVQVTFDFLERHGLIEIVSEDELILPETVNSIGSESDSAERVRRHRAKKKALHSNTNVTTSNDNVTSSNDAVTSSNIDIDIDKDKEIDIESEIDSDTDFALFWNIYPRKLDKERTYKEWSDLLSKGYQVTDLIQSATNYATTVAGTSPQYIKHPKNFLIDKTFVDYLSSNFKPNDNNVIPLAKHTSQFNNFPQRQYSKEDYTKLEKALLQKQTQ